MADQLGAHDRGRTDSLRQLRKISPEVWATWLVEVVHTQCNMLIMCGWGLPSDAGSERCPALLCSEFHLPSLGKGLENGSDARLTRRNQSSVGGVRICLTGRGRRTRRSPARTNDRVVRQVFGELLEPPDAEAQARILRRLRT